MGAFLCFVRSLSPRLQHPTHGRPRQSCRGAQAPLKNGVRWHEYGRCLTEGEDHDIGGVYQQNLQQGRSRKCLTKSAKSVLLTGLTRWNSAAMHSQLKYLTRRTEKLWTRCSMNTLCDKFHIRVDALPIGYPGLVC